MLMTPWQRNLLTGLAHGTETADRLVTEGDATAEGDLLQLERLGFDDREPAACRQRLSIGMLAQWLRSS
jgi:hypothetical protein